MPPEPSDQELIEYAGSLIEVGCLQEAFGYLERVDTKKFPEALLIRSFGLFANWDYVHAIPLLEQYIDNSKISDYQKLVGKINLAASMIFEQPPLRK